MSNSRAVIIIISILIEAKAEMEAKDIYGRTPLHLASQNGHFDTVKKLIDNGADVNATDKGGDSPLTLAMARNHIDIVSKFSSLM